MEKDQRISELQAKGVPGTDEGQATEELDRLCRRSERLLEKLQDLESAAEPERQWQSLMENCEDAKTRLSQIEELVQRRLQQLPAGDKELRLCRAIKGLCVGAQKVTPRRWSVTELSGSL